MYTKQFNAKHIGHFLNIHPRQKVLTPCCSRMDYADMVTDFRMLPEEKRPHVYKDRSDGAFVCDECIRHSVLNLQTHTYEELAIALGAPKSFIEGYRGLDRNHKRFRYGE